MARKPDWRDAANELLALLMKQEDITQNELARRARMPKSTVSKLTTRMKKSATFEDYAPLFECINYSPIAAYLIVFSRHPLFQLALSQEYSRNAEDLWHVIAPHLDEELRECPTEAAANTFTHEFRANLRDWPHSGGPDGWTNDRANMLVYRINKNHRLETLGRAVR